MKIETVSTSKAPQAIGPYSQAVRCGDVLYTSGQIGMNPKTGELVSERIEDQAKQTMENLLAVLGAAGLSLDRCVKITIYLTDLSVFDAVNEIYASFFRSHLPARAVVGVAQLPKGAQIEMDCIAVTE